MKDLDPKNENDHQDHLEVEPVPIKELEKVRSQEIESANQSVSSGRNIFIGTLNVFIGPMRAFIDPVKKVCYPTLSAHWDQKYKQPFAHHAWKILLFDLVLLFLASSLAVSLVLIYKFLPPVSPPDLVSVTLAWPDQITSGTETDLVLSYTNRTDQTLKDGRLIIELPSNFIPLQFNQPEETTTEPDQPVSFKLGNLAPDSTGRVTISGQPFGSPNDELPILIRLSYWEDGLAEITEQSAFYQLHIDNTPLELALNFEQPFLYDTVSTIRLTYANRGEQLLHSTIIKLILPPEFTLSGSTPLLSEGQIWKMSDLAPGKSGVLTLHGRLDHGGTPSFGAIGSVLEPISGLELEMNQIHSNPDAVATGFELSHDLHGMSSIRPGETVNITVNYANHGNQSIHDIILKLETDERFLELGEVPIQTWTSKDIPELDELKPGQSGSLETTFKVKKRIGYDSLQGDTSAALRLTATAEYHLENNQSKIFRTDSGTSDLPISTTMNIDASTLYYTESGDQLGLGPLPPTVDQTTSLWVMIALDNGINSARDVQLTALLPVGSIWTGRTNVAIGEPLIHISDERKVVWRINDLPALAGWFGPRPTAGFEIEFTPTKNDVGTAPNLVEYLTLTGIDAVTGVRIMSEAEPVTTEVRFGNEEERQGLVR